MVLISKETLPILLPLQALIDQFIAEEDFGVRDGLMEQILLKWTGSDTVDPYLIKKIVFYANTRLSQRVRPAGVMKFTSVVPTVTVSSRVRLRSANRFGE